MYSLLKKYKLINIVHSGRKGLRGDKVTAEKYDDVIGSEVLFDINDIKQFKNMTFLFKNHPIYDYWTTSEVLALRTDDDGTICAETVNSIYIFESC